MEAAIPRRQLESIYIKMRVNKPTDDEKFKYKEPPRSEWGGVKDVFNVPSPHSSVGSFVDVMIR
jgi:hypothetical protein